MHDYDWAPAGTTPAGTTYQPGVIPDAMLGGLLFAVAGACLAAGITDPDAVDQVMADIYTRGIPQRASEAMALVDAACSRVRAA